MQTEATTGTSVKALSAADTTNISSDSKVPLSLFLGPNVQ